jgi:hypothetical protein
VLGERHCSTLIYTLPCHKTSTTSVVHCAAYGAHSALRVGRYMHCSVVCAADDRGISRGARSWSESTSTAERRPYRSLKGITNHSGPQCARVLRSVPVVRCSRGAHALHCTVSAYFRAQRAPGARAEQVHYLCYLRWSHKYLEQTQRPPFLRTNSCI